MSMPSGANNGKEENHPPPSLPIPSSSSIAKEESIENEIVAQVNSQKLDTDCSSSSAVVLLSLSTSTKDKLEGMCYGHLLSISYYFLFLLLLFPSHDGCIKNTLRLHLFFCTF